MTQYLQAIKAALKKADSPLLERWATQTKTIDVPDICIEKQFSAARISASSKVFNNLHDWQYNTLHPCLPLFLGLSQHIGVLTDNQSPFPLMGLVHIENSITQKRPLAVSTMDIRCYFGAIWLHPRGIAVDITMEVCQNNHVCQTISSTYLHRQTFGESTAAHQAKTETPAQPPSDPLAVTSPLSFDSLAGLRYARISGDYNPIHLFAWSARIFGFKHAIAHGIHVLARSISTLACASTLPAQEFSIVNDFRYPVPLPSRLIVSSSEKKRDYEARSISFELRNPGVAHRKQVVLSGRITE